MKEIFALINDEIERVLKDNSGSIAKNRLTIQISFAIQKMVVELYNVEDYTVFMDCIEDVAVKATVAGDEKLYLYQVKTKQNDHFTLTYIINENWIEKLYKHKKDFSSINCEISLVSNVDVIDDDHSLFPNKKSNFEKDIINSTDPKKNQLYKIKKSICTNEGISIDEVDLSSFYYIKTSLHTDSHKEQALLSFFEFISQMDNSAEIKKVKALFTTLYDTLDSRFNNEISPLNTNYNEIVSLKGYTKREFSDAIHCYMNTSIPKNTDLFSLLGINSIAEQSEIGSKRTQFLMDYTSKDSSFIAFLCEIRSIVSQSNQNDLLENGLQIVMNNDNISSIYKDPGYIKFSLAYIYYLYINGQTDSLETKL